MSDAELLNLPVAVGLRQQGHMETVIRMVLQHASWEEIGAAIHWEPTTLQRWYELEIAAELTDLTARRAVSEARVVAMEAGLRKIAEGGCSEDFSFPCSGRERRGGWEERLSPIDWCHPCTAIALLKEASDGK